MYGQFGNYGGYGGYGFNAFGLLVPTPLPGDPGFQANVRPEGFSYCGSPFGLQQMLRDLGYSVGAIDGKIGNNTNAAANAFASKAGVTYGTDAFCQRLMDVWSAKMVAPTQPGETPQPRFDVTKLSPSVLKSLTHVQMATDPRRRVAANGGATNGKTNGKNGKNGKTNGKTNGKNGNGKELNWWEERSTTEKVAIGAGAAVVVGGIMFLLLRKSEPSYQANRYTPPRRKKRWAQKVDADIAKRGTEGVFGRQARRAGYDNTMKYAVHVVDDWNLGETPKTAANRLKMKRANLALNFQGTPKRKALMKKYG